MKCLNLTIPPKISSDMKFRNNNMKKKMRNDGLRKSDYNSLDYALDLLQKLIQ